MFYKISVTITVIPACLPDKNIRVQVWRESIFAETMDARQKHSGMTRRSIL